MREPLANILNLQMKKSHPLIVLEKFEKFVHLKGENFEVIPPDNYLLKVIDKDKDSNFYFFIEQYKVDKDLRILLDYKPYSKDSTNNRRGWINAKELDSIFNIWVDLLKNYETVDSFYDDPIIKSYIDEYYSNIKLLDEDADVNPFNSKQVLLLDNYLSEIVNRIEKYIDKDNEFQIAEIITDTEELKKDLTKYAKNIILNRLCIVWAKISKQGVPLIKELIYELAKDFAFDFFKKMLGM